MQITLIKKREFNKLVDIQKKYPILTFQNNGYEYIDKSKFSIKEERAFNVVSSILSSCILGFVKFNNFRLDKNNEIQVRFQYNWNAEDKEKLWFTGVGYLHLDELHKGFRKGFKNEN